MNNEQKEFLKTHTHKIGVDYCPKCFEVANDISDLTKCPNCNGGLIWGEFYLISEDNYKKIMEIKD